jgi:hypothetical protein
MRSSSPRPGKTIETQGLWLFGGLSVLLALGKAISVWDWSWWRVALPLLIFVVFNVLYITTGLLYLSVVSVRQRPQEEESSLLRTHTDTAHYWAGLLCVSGFALRLLLDSRVVDVLRLSSLILVTLSSLKPLFCNGLKKALHFLDNVGASDPGIH